MFFKFFIISFGNMIDGFSVFQWPFCSFDLWDSDVEYFILLRTNLGQSFYVVFLLNITYKFKFINLKLMNLINLLINK